jgi:hypothetical protein
MKTLSRWLGFALVISLIGMQCVAMAQEKGYSHVRIVRLSFVDGTVLVRRPNATQWAKALVNTPIEQGFTVSTANGSYAETQFENGSTARLGQRSRLDFAELALTPKGDKINHLVFDQGYGTFKFEPKHGDEYSVQAGNTTITPRGKSEFRVDLNQGTVRVEVFDGSVRVKNPDRTADLGKGKVLEYSTGNEEALNISHGIQQDAWDKWVHGRDQQTELALSDSAVGMDSPVYGWSDLDQYGEWAMFPGFGYGWAPFEPMGWTPFSMGQWSWYSGFGPTWISAEPWGWLPFHYGFWNYDPSFGYFWMPGMGGFNTFYPGLVDWYSGPGYVAWAPMGAGGRPACATSNCFTAVRRGVIQNGGLITPARRVPVNLSQLRPVSRLNMTPGPLARLSGTPVARGYQITGRPGQPVAARMASLRSSARAPAMVARVASPGGSRPAPRILFMGQTPAQGAKEMRALTAHRSFFSRAFSSPRIPPIQAHLGNTLGGHYAIMRHGAVNGLRPMSMGAGPQARYEGGRMMRSGPVLLPHASAMGDAHPIARMGEGGGIRAVSRGPSGGFSGPGSVGAFHGSPGMGEGVSHGMAGASHGAAAGGGGGHAH